MNHSSSPWTPWGRENGSITSKIARLALGPLGLSLSIYSSTLFQNYSLKVDFLNDKFTIPWDLLF